MLQNNGKSAHQEVPHVHFHNIPKGGEGLSVKMNSTSLTDGEDIKAKIVSALEGLKDENRLPTMLSPNYKVTLKPDFSSFKFEGVVVVQVDVLRETSTITHYMLMNSKTLLRLTGTAVLTTRTIS